ncbi:HD domain-containing phosphohydrolase [Maridesulfovibrio hydrothermalis]|uniref:Putative PAS/PAC sensor protein n=1 Tax=Maridesulfovibrio hydrothermalis AM13 = DSM 14728 TaxID=1121451 RepID=L0RF12_9BACT|nr:HD domain-containing phosphohydrolase [Maridesulfovibrio hydrothermalis]CCO24146.1 putative PAS/PAC sensor protein [Maridesulfovibrio hydrothermalis AM13 = DSM 14728]
MLKRILEVIKNIFTLKNCALILLVLAVSGGTFYGLTKLWKEKKVELDAKLEKYQSVIVENETELLTSQLVKYIIQGRELAKSRIFRSSIDGLSSSNKEKVRNAQEDFKNFIKVSGFSSGFLFNLDGRLFATTSGPLEGNESEYEESIKKVIESRGPLFSPLHIHNGYLVSDLFLPVFPAKALSSSVAPVKVMVLTVPMSETLRAFLASEQSLEYDSKIHLVQQVGSGFEETVFSYPDSLKLQSVAASLDGVTDIKFGSRTDLYKTKQVYSSAGYISAIRWWIMVETDVATINGQLAEYKNITSLIAALGLGTIVFFILTISFITSSRKYYLKSQKLEEKLVPSRKYKKILLKVCDALPFPMSLKDSETGVFLYINKAFAEFSGLKVTEAEGLTDNQVFDSADAESLAHGDQMVIMSGNSYSHELVLSKGVRQITMQVLGIPCSLNAENDAILTVYRDISIEKETTTKSIEMRQQIINALVRAVESVPFLDGHTSLMRLLAVEIAETLLLSDADCATVEAAAILSQVGKTFIPKEIMEKEGKLTPEELLETQKYVEHTCRILEGITFDLPITQTIWQMQETLDGTGYPNKLQGREISLLARILGATNTFSALVQHRAYRKAKTAQEAVAILQSMADKKFDSSVIDALDAVIHSQNGKSILRASSVEL